MKTYISDIIPKIQRFSQKLDNLTLLTNQHWVVMDDIDKSKNVYIFRQNNELLISQNGIVEKAKWEYLGHNSILIDRKKESYLFKHGFFDENILALKIDSKNEYAFLVNESKFDKELNTLSSVYDFLTQKYISSKIPDNLIAENKTELSHKFNFNQKQALLVPEYKLVKTKSIHIINSKTEKYLIQFMNGLTGYIYYKPKTDRYYVKLKPKGAMTTNKYYCDNFENCIIVLNNFLMKNEIINDLIN